MTACTWDPAHAGASASFSNGNKTVAIGSAQSLRGTVGYSDVKRFFEVKYAANAGAPQAAVVGLAEIGVDVTAGLGAGVIAHGYSWGYYENSGEILYNNGAVAYGAVFTTLDLIGILFDPIVGTLTWYLNGVSQGLYTNAALIGFTGFPAASAASGSANKLTYTLRCSLADIVGPIPAGSIAWDASVIPPGASGSLFGVM